MLGEVLKLEASHLRVGREDQPPLGDPEKPGAPGPVVGHLPGFAWGGPGMSRAYRYRLPGWARDRYRVPQSYPAQG